MDNTSKKLGVRLYEGHAYLTINGGNWVLDTGSPVSFGEADLHPLETTLPFSRKNGHLGAESLSEFLGVSVAGLIGGDFLNWHDHHIDLRGGSYCILESAHHDGTTHALSFPEQLAGIPTIKARVGGDIGDFIFDTGAQLSYYLGAPPHGHIPGPEVEDFWPGLGRFKTQTYTTKAVFSDYQETFRFGVPPAMLRAFLTSKGVRGIIGIDLIAQHACAYSPRRKLLTINR